MVYLDYFFTLYGTSLSIEGLTDDEKTLMESFLRYMRAKQERGKALR